MGGAGHQQLSFSPPEAQHGVLPGQVRVLTLNVQHASPSRSRRQADWLAGQDADVVVLTEVTPGGHSIAQELSERGFSVHLADGGSDYLTVVASRIGKQEPVPEVRPGHLPHRCAAVRIHLDDGLTVGVVGLYVPSRGPRERRNVDKRAFQNAVVELLPDMAGELAVTGPVVIAGDLNVVERGHRPHHTVFGTWEYEFYAAFAAAGYGDAFRHCHPDGLDHSWYGRRSGEGYRFDHIFSSPVAAVVDCRYVHEPRTTGLSDHAAMTATLAVPASTL
ncbi:endonuclease/exonuclease/phosphatase family protein [Streptosporangium amethystogenes subsp. fukuiense]|uniref:Endonuclease/exonuclease/phosphatase family protein n=1 Tax=Streptosporangium amethystogenes subsp. fukuiense TaxID=698418 RepID=A0ABW2SY27_9ACTN